MPGVHDARQGQSGSDIYPMTPIRYTEVRASLAQAWE